MGCHTDSAFNVLSKYKNIGHKALRGKFASLFLDKELKKIMAICSCIRMGLKVLECALIGEADGPCLWDETD